MTLRSKWWLFGFFGAFLLGSGMSIVAESSYWKHDGSHWTWWVLGGIIGIASALSGVVFLVNAGILQYKMSLKAEN